MGDARNDDLRVRFDSRLKLKNVVKFYNGRGTAEQWIKEGKNAVK